MTAPLDIDALVLINEMLTCNKCSEERKLKVQACMSSYFYYDSLEEQVTCIVTSILKGHFFLDGNKRTAFAIYLDLCQNNDLKILGLDENALGDIFIRMASSQGSVEENTKILFPA